MLKFGYIAVLPYIYHKSINMNNKWRDDVTIYELWEKYDISINGRVIWRKNGKEVRHYIARYPIVRLRFNSKAYTVTVHRLMALKYVPNPENKPEINHKNGNKLDFSIENLEWCTRAENVRHAVRAGLKKSGEDHYRSKTSNETILEIRRQFHMGARKSELAKRYGLCKSYVGQVINGSRRNNL